MHLARGGGQFRIPHSHVDLFRHPTDLIAEFRGDHILELAGCSLNGFRDSPTFDPAAIARYVRRH